MSTIALTGCAGNQPAPRPTTFDGSLEQVQVVMMHDMGAAEQFCIDRLGEGTPAGRDCYDYARQVCNDTTPTIDPKHPLRGDCTRRLESYGWTTGSN